MVVTGWQSVDVGPMARSLLNRPFWFPATRFIYLNLDDCFGMKRISLYQRVQPHCLELFKYILLVKCTNVNAQNTPELLEFVQRLRVKLLSAYISSYELCK